MSMTTENTQSAAHAPGLNLEEQARILSAACREFAGCTLDVFDEIEDGGCPFNTECIDVTERAWARWLRRKESAPVATAADAGGAA